MKYSLLFLLYCSSLFAWGWDSHKYINEQAIDLLPPEMAFFQDQREYIRQHSVDPDTDDQPGYYHYFDIDYYPEFFEGTLPHDMDSLLLLYDETVLQNTGMVPWVIEEWADSLSTLMADGDWNTVWQVAAELGHYVADAHQPLHLTVNYNGQYTGNYGIHSRYETKMINPHLPELPEASGEGEYWATIIDSVFQAIEEIYPFVDSIMIADDLATSQDPDYSSTYYTVLWEQLEELTTISIHRAILDLASLWRTAWENAGSPSPLNIKGDVLKQERGIFVQNYPNPFNPSTTIEYFVPGPSHVRVELYDVIGQLVEVLVNKRQTSGFHHITWHGFDYASGVYIYRIKSADFERSGKMLLLE